MIENELQCRTTRLALDKLREALMLAEAMPDPDEFAEVYLSDLRYDIGRLKADLQAWERKPQDARDDQTQRSMA